MIQIEHIAIWVKDLEKMQLFYEKYFGATANDIYVNPTKNFSSYFLSFGTGPRLEIMHRPEIPDDQNNVALQHIGLIHFAISIGNEKKVDEMTERLRSDGFEILGEPRWTGDGYYESVVLDPEGNRIEITA
ncbi:MAG: VOC family protein [Saprospiraceae bacterium]